MHLHGEVPAQFATPLALGIIITFAATVQSSDVPQQIRDNVFFDIGVRHRDPWTRTLGARQLEQNGFGNPNQAQPRHNFVGRPLRNRAW